MAHEWGAEGHEIGETPEPRGAVWPWLCLHCDCTAGTSGRVFSLWCLLWLCGSHHAAHALPTLPLCSPPGAPAPPPPWSFSLLLLGLTSAPRVPPISGEIHVYAGNSKLPKDLQASETSPFTFSAAGFLDPAVRQLLRSPRAMLPEENGNSHEKPASQGHSQGRK